MTKHHFKILPEHQLQNLDQTLKLCAPSLNKNLALRPNFTFQICNKLLSTHFSSSTWATVTTSTNLSCHLYMPGSHKSSLLNRSQWVSEWVSDKHSQWSDSGPIKMRAFPSKGLRFFAHKVRRGNLVLTFPSICFSWNFCQIISGTNCEESTSFRPITCHSWQENSKYICCWSFGTVIGPFEPIWTFSGKIQFFAPKTHSAPLSKTPRTPRVPSRVRNQKTKPNNTK